MAKKIQAIQLNIADNIMTVNFNKINTVMENIRTLAQAEIDKGEVKGTVMSPWLANGKYAGYANFMLQTSLINNDVGIVVNSYSGFNSCLVDINRLLKKGYHTLFETAGSKRDVAAATTVTLFLETFQGKYNFSKDDIKRVAIGYETVTDSGEEAVGYRIVDIDPQKATEIIRRITDVDIRNTPLTDLREFCLDMAAFARQAGENTIDTRKKPVLIVITGIPGLDDLKQFVQYMSHQDYEFKICWDENGASQNGYRISKERGIRLLMNDKDIVKREKIENGDKVYYRTVTDKQGNPVQCYLEDERIGGAYGESYQRVIKADGKVIGKKLFMCDVPHKLWKVLARRFKNFLEGISVRFNGADIQKMLDQEMRQIIFVATKYNNVNGFKTFITDVIEGIKQEYQSAFSASEATQADIKKQGKESNLAKELIKDLIDNEKAELSEILRRLQNKTRVAFNTLEAIMSQQTGKTVVISPADRVRLIWKVVLDNATVNGVINWKKVSALPQTLLEPEYLLWVLDAFKGTEFETLIPRQTKDKIHLEGTFKDMTPEEVAELNGLKVPFVDGEFVFEGETKLSCKVPLNGTFDIKVDEDGIFAMHDIESLVVVPPADNKVAIVKLTSGDTESIRSITQAAMDANEVWFVKGEKGKGNPIAIVNDQDVKIVGTYLLHFSKVATNMFNIDYASNKNNGLKGIVNFYKPFDYRDRAGNWQSTAFLAIDITGELSEEERKLAGF